MRFLKQSTSVDVKVGPFLDETDGKTAETALTITQPDVRLAKNGGAWAQKAAAQTLSHEENGWYEVTLDATDTNTLGILIVAIHESGALPVWIEFMVLPANVYDSLVGGSDNLEVDTTLWKGATAPAMTGDAYARLGAPVGASISADLQTVDDFLDTEIAAIKAKTDNLPSDPADASDIAAAFDKFAFNKNTQYATYMFLMVDATDGYTPETGLTVSCTRSIDGAAFAACANSPTEVASGWYKITLATTDLNGDEIVLRFTAAGARNWEHKIRTIAT